jgi:hypothetical protein
MHGTMHALCIFSGLLAIRSFAYAQQDSVAIADSVLLQSLQLQMQLATTPPPPPRSAPSTNPNMSVIGDFRASYMSPARRHVDAELHEAEIALQSVVDPYARADFYLSIARDPATGTFGLGLEEGVLTSLDLPGGLQLKGGKFRSTFGKINNIHPHALPFVDVPVVYEKFLGEEGLNDEGLSLSWLVPNPWDFYQELTLEATRGPDESPSFVRSAVDRYLYLAHVKNFWDVTDNATLELGLSAVTGQNDSSYSSVLGGIDVTYKWKPLQFNTYQSLVLQAEALWSRKQMTGADVVRSWGMYALATYQIAQRWFLTGRFDYTGMPDKRALLERSCSGVIGWNATEFQKVELQYTHALSDAGLIGNQLMLRSIFVIGAHGAHAY